MNKGTLEMEGTPREIFKQAERLKKIGLGVPQGAELAQRLRKEGFNLPDDIYTLDEVCDAILKLKGVAQDV